MYKCKEQIVVIENKKKLITVLLNNAMDFKNVENRIIFNLKGMEISIDLLFHSLRMVDYGDITSTTFDKVETTKDKIMLYDRDILIFSLNFNTIV